MAARRRVYRIGIVGSYGGLNLGDEAILQSMLQQIRACRTLRFRQRRGPFLVPVTVIGGGAALVGRLEVTLARSRQTSSPDLYWFSSRRQCPRGHVPRPWGRGISHARRRPVLMKGESPCFPGL